MRPTRRIAAVLAVGAGTMLVGVTLARHATAQAPPTPSPAVAALEKSVAAEPTEAVLTYFLAVMRARAGDAPGTLGALEQTLAHGDGFLPPDDYFETLQGDRRFRDLRARFARKLPRVVTGNVVATLSDDPLLIPEGVAHDGAEDVLYVGSIARRGIYRIGRSGKLEPLSSPADELDFVLGDRDHGGRPGVHRRQSSTVAAQRRHR